MGIAVSGLTADARSLAKYMRMECLNHKYVYGSTLETSRLVVNIADKKQECTQSYVRRPYGVGLLVAGFDATGPHLYETSPAGTYLEWKAMAIGARSQSAKTYLEKHFESFPGLGKDELIKHALQALSGCSTSDKELDAKSASISYIAKDGKYTVLEGDALQPYLDAIETSDGADDAAGGDADGGAEDENMQ
jgi:20S proteasome subunit alpha 6